MITTSLRLFAGLAIAGGLLSTAATAATAAIAAPAIEAPTATVRYNDLDLASPAGARQLERRIAAAAASVCPTGDNYRLETLRIANQCRANAVASARGKADQVVAQARSAQRYAANEANGHAGGL